MIHLSLQYSFYWCGLEWNPRYLRSAYIFITSIQRQLAVISTIKVRSDSMGGGVYTRGWRGTRITGSYIHYRMSDQPYLQTPWMPKRNTLLFCLTEIKIVINISMSSWHTVGPHWASLVAQMVKNSPAVQETWVWSLGWDGEGNGYPLQYSCLENSMVRRGWWATVHEVTKS